jgi:hypothetical protein
MANHAAECVQNAGACPTAGRGMTGQSPAQRENRLPSAACLRARARGRMQSKERRAKKRQAKRCFRRAPKTLGAKATRRAGAWVRMQGVRSEQRPENHADQGHGGGQKGLPPGSDKAKGRRTCHRRQPESPGLAEEMAALRRAADSQGGRSSQETGTTRTKDQHAVSRSPWRS